MSEIVSLSIAAIAIAVGAGTQRITGMGLALVCAPALVLAFGPVTAVTLTNTIAIVLNIGIITITYRHLRWRKAFMIATGAVVVIPPLSFILRGVNTAWLQIIIGIIVLLAVSSILFRRKQIKTARQTVLGFVASGAASGALGAAAGLSGPPLALYAAKTNWQGSEFVPTIQAASLVINILAVATAPPIQISMRVWFIVMLSMLVGMVLGSLLTSKMKSQQVRSGTLILSAIGGLITIFTGLNILL